ncbi:MAG: DUF2306 domain-containing protein [Oceanicaulis sp.]|uniref:DUF2306 domain-containing protein n=1 Tax=Glycocaulis sp. TaxID=1969725 RepID=UPI0025C5710C|nr:DUF2306 domain-containing protein [Glycocaulis sp.]MCC5982542.1 DUF2306 domain-containing protein [Oceanicaulis sp.]MCH8520323.1 DUF2306 domain-containing protein [Glycocaulis sp.]
MTRQTPPGGLPARLLQGSAALWFVVAAAFQLLFAFYIAALYGTGTLRGDSAVWNLIMRNGHIEGDPAGNAAMMAHVLLACLITLGGLAQLTPQIRNRFPAFHRWNGRVYLTLAVIISLAGLFLTWTRPAASGLSNDISISLNGVLILIFAAFTVRHAMARRIDIHRRWATRLFLAVSGVWFLRIMISGWIMFHQAPLWLGDRLDGPAGVAFGFASFLLPLAVYELYLRAGDGQKAGAKLASAALIAALAGLTAFGGIAAAMIMWLPFI